MSSDYTDYLDAGDTPPDGSQYWVAPFVSDFLNNHKNVLDDKCDSYLREKTGMQIQWRYIMADIKYDILEELGVLSEIAKGWKKELNLISWNGGASKYDIRDWAPQHEKMGKGITLSKDEIKELYKILGKILEEQNWMVILLRRAEGRETFYRLLEWDKGQAASERLG